MTENPELLLSRVTQLLETIKQPPPAYSVVIVVDGLLQINSTGTTNLKGKYVCAVTPKDLIDGFSRHTAAMIVSRLKAMQASGLLKS